MTPHITVYLGGLFACGRKGVSFEGFIDFVDLVLVGVWRDMCAGRNKSFGGHLSRNWCGYHKGWMDGWMDGWTRHKSNKCCVWDKSTLQKIRVSFSKNCCKQQ